MVRRQWLTVPDELTEYADQVVEHFETHGYSVKFEATETGFPGTPTLVAKQARGRTTVIVEVQQSIDADRLHEWARFAKACSTETRVIVCVPPDIPRAALIEQSLREAGIGILLASPTGVMELVASRDLTINVSLPELRTMPRKMQRLLGPVYEKFERGQWQDGFSDACQVLEVEARRYLLEGVRRGRLTFRALPPPGARVRASSAPRKVKVYSERAISRMTLGGLAVAFSEIEIQNHADVVILNALSHVNRDRVGRAHHAARAVTDRRLRTNVGRHMWVVADGLKAALGIA